MKGCEESLERRKSYVARKTANPRGTREIRHFPLAPIFRRLGARTAHPQGRSASEGRAALRGRAADRELSATGGAAVATLFVLVL